MNILDLFLILGRELLLFKELVHFIEFIEFMCVELFIVFPYYSFDICRVYSDSPCLLAVIGHFCLSLSFLLYFSYSALLEVCLKKKKFFAMNWLQDDFLCFSCTFNLIDFCSYFLYLCWFWGVFQILEWKLKLLI